MRSEARRVFRRLMQLRELEGGRGAGGWWRGTLRGPPMTTERLTEPLPADVRAIGARTRDVECLLRQLDRLLVARSEEHTSELQSLMRISYAVFCLNQKK